MRVLFIYLFLRKRGIYVSSSLVQDIKCIYIQANIIISLFSVCVFETLHNNMLWKHLEQGGSGMQYKRRHIWNVVSKFCGGKLGCYARICSKYLLSCCVCLCLSWRWQIFIQFYGRKTLLSIALPHIKIKKSDLTAALISPVCNIKRTQQKKDSLM